MNPGAARPPGPARTSLWHARTTTRSPQGHVDSAREERIMQLKRRQGGLLRHVEDDLPVHLVPGVDRVQERLVVLIGVELGSAVVLVFCPSYIEGSLRAAGEGLRFVADVFHRKSDHAEFALCL